MPKLFLKFQEKNNKKKMITDGHKNKATKII